MNRLNKSSALFVILIIAISSLLIVFNIPFGLAQSGTNETGIISSDSTWTQTNSPYNLTGNVFVNNGVTLTLEPRATVNLNGYSMEVNGSVIVREGVTINFETFNASISINGVLDATGTAESPIVINGARGFALGELFPVYPSIFFGQTSSESIIENAIINLTNIRAENSIKINNNTITGKVGEGGVAMSFSGGLNAITNNDIKYFELGFFGGSSTVSNNRMRQTFINLEMFNHDHTDVNAKIISNDISDAQTFNGFYQAAITLSNLGKNGQALIEKNLITNSFKGVDINDPDNLSSSIIQDNTIVNNSIGVVIDTLYSPTIINNNIYGNTYLFGTTGYNMELGVHASNGVNATNNWWGTTDVQAIRQTIYDSKDDSNLGTVNFNPFLTAPNPQAPSINTPNPTPTPSSSQTSFPSPTIPEFPLLTFSLLLTVMVALAGLLVYHEKQKQGKLAVYA